MHNDIQRIITLWQQGRAGGVMTKPERGDKYKCHSETEPEVKMQTQSKGRMVYISINKRRCPSVCVCVLPEDFIYVLVSVTFSLSTHSQC